ncbi:sensor histidine kinase [Pedobacter metabolipauper]|uniref:Histidine kinase n=1 Tax=Pedobacter metabolipauper TaxID=425513 RepID=A0A4V3D155_9SPHI|nr:histidine kinase [Pedobacter metabolipauper]TDQ09347.1 histidine kinase [Pedobacter metabolipauper]
MKKILVLLALVCFIIETNAQKKDLPADTTAEDTNDKYFKFIGSIRLDIRKATKEQLDFIKKKEILDAIKKDRFLFLGDPLFNANAALAVRFEKNTGSAIYEGVKTSMGNRDIPSIIIDGKAGVDFAYVSITKEDAKDYRYHIVQNFNNELVQWKTPDIFRTTKNGKAAYAYLGKFDYHPNQVLLVEIYNIKNYRKRHAIVIDWREIKPAKLSVGVESIRDNLSSRPVYSSLDELNIHKYENFIETTDLNHKKFRISDSLVRLNISLGRSGSFNYNVKLKRTIKGTTEIIDLYDYRSQLYVYREYWKLPGEYELIFTPKVFPPGGKYISLLNGKAAHYKFTVLPPLNQSILITYKEFALSILSIITLAGLVIWYFILRNRIRLITEKQKKELAVMQLSTVRAQLNPHFMFNALAGIQNLMNKNDIDTANRYLGKFARLTRNVLDEKSNELISIADEKMLLDDYLQMEQLRFGFTYSIKIDDEINATIAEIPAMLLQPFVENAVKHGIAGLSTDGKIEIAITKKQNNLVLQVSDNGKGFDSTLNYPTFGLNLSKSRIELLNTIYKDTPAELSINSSNEGTIITILLKDWL